MTWRVIWRLNSSLVLSPFIPESLLSVDLNVIFSYLSLAAIAIPGSHYIDICFIISFDSGINITWPAFEQQEIRGTRTSCFFLWRTLFQKDATLMRPQCWTSCLFCP